MPVSENSGPPGRGASLEALLGEIASGGRDAFETLYRMTSRQLFGVCLRVLVERSEAEDALQETFTAVWRNAAQFDGTRGRASVWLAMIARNKSIDHLRARPGRDRIAPTNLMDELEDPDASPLEDTQALADSNRLQGCLRQLELQHRSLICAAFYDGSTYEELAKRVGAPLGTVKSWIRRALMQLRACLHEQ
ncbi:MAG: sigma-70 family RNA polymerase sigma factor [Steroidobacteraceae bacterium]